MNLQTVIQNTFKTTFQLTETIAPPLARRWATNLFVQPMKFKRPAREAALIADAQIEHRHFQGFYPRPLAESYYVTYRWGSDSGPTVLLVHGWAGRGSQMATMVAPLLSAGYRVMTFDAPAHGNSPGRRTNLLEVSTIIHDLNQGYGEFAAIVGHSFGGMAAGYALQQGVSAAKLITIGSPVTMDYILTSFGSQINASPPTVAATKAHLQSLTDRNVDDFSLSQTLAHSTVPGLILHDQADRDVAVEQAHLLHAAWPNSELQITRGLGHRRILRDETTINRIVAFIRAAPASTQRQQTTIAADSVPC